MNINHAKCPYLNINHLTIAHYELYDDESDDDKYTDDDGCDLYDELEVINMMILRVSLPLVRLQEAWPPINPSIVGVDWTEIIIIMISTEAK